MDCPLPEIMTKCREQPPLDFRIEFNQMLFRQILRKDNQVISISWPVIHSQIEKESQKRTKQEWKLCFTFNVHILQVKAHAHYDNHNRRIGFMPSLISEQT